jgi:hypothetical protein
LKIYVQIYEEDEENEYSCKINLKKLKQKYKILNSIKDVKNFIEILDKLTEKNQLKIKYYLKKFVVQVGLSVTNLLGKIEEITFELLPEETETEVLMNNLVKELIKLRKRANNELLKKEK